MRDNTDINFPSAAVITQRYGLVALKPSAVDTIMPGRTR